MPIYRPHVRIDSLNLCTNTAQALAHAQQYQPQSPDSLESTIMIYAQDLPSQAVHVYAGTYAANSFEDWHEHACFQLIYAISGLLRVRTHDAVWMLPSTYAVWLPPHTPHRLEMLTDVAARSVFVQPLARADLIPHPQTSQVTPLLRELIVRAATFTPPIAAHSMQERVCELILDELRALKQEPLYVPLPQEGKLKAVCDVLLDRLHHPWQLADVAQLAAVNERTISRYFRQETGLSFQEWLRRQRLLTALSYLVQGKSIIATALAVGYDNASAFSAMFKSYMHMTPSDYQAQVKAQI